MTEESRFSSYYTAILYRKVVFGAGLGDDGWWQRISCKSSVSETFLLKKNAGIFPIGVDRGGFGIDGIVAESIYTYK